MWEGKGGGGGGVGVGGGGMYVHGIISMATFFNQLASAHHSTEYEGNLWAVPVSPWLI